MLAVTAASLALLQSTGRAAPPIPAGDDAIVHALNRLTYGPRPGDVEQVRRIGLPAWIDRQLNPSRIDNRALDARLAAYPTLTLDSAEIARTYYLPAQEARRARARDMTDDDAPSRPQPEVAAALRQARQVIDELASAKLVRSVYSERQLEEVLVDFWFNHFNVFAAKGRTGTFITEYEREAIRPHVFGRFRDLLEATAKSPAMLFYLDNWMSADPEAMKSLDQRLARARRSGRMRNQRTPQQAQNRPTGLNENYARELLELHTLGVDGGYSQADVVEVARAFTGWTIGRPGEEGFRFVRAMHDDRQKVVLGQTIPAGGGIEDGRRVLDIVAVHPSTARHIATKLARRFVSDTPPEALVARAAARFRETRGDLREVVRTIVTSPEFFGEEARRAKIKTPLEFLASALRATRAEVTNARPLLLSLQQLGMPLYLCQPPTGYDDTAETWVSSGALVHRMNVALQLGDHRTRGVATPLSAVRDLDSLRQALLQDALGGTVSDTTRATIEKASTPQQVLALAIGSPEFQRR